MPTFTFGGAFLVGEDDNICVPGIRLAAAAHQSLDVDFVIRVSERDVSATGSLQTYASRSTRPHMLEEQASDPQSTLRKVLEQSSRVVRRAIVHEDHFQVVRDGQASQESRQVVLGVERGDNDRKGQVRFPVV